LSRRLPLSLVALTLSAAALPAAEAGAQAPASGTIVAIGSASVTPTPGDRKSDASISKAVVAAQAAALPLAIRAARARAQVLATESGLTLGPLVGIADEAPSPFGGFGPFGTDGTFGPGRYCGTVSRFRTVRLPNGSFRRTRLGTRRLCRIPNRVGTTVAVTYATGVPVG